MKRVHNGIKRKQQCNFQKRIAAVNVAFPNANYASINQNYASLIILPMEPFCSIDLYRHLIYIKICHDVAPTIIKSKKSTYE